MTAVTAESSGCVWHFQQRYAGHDVLEVSLEWTYGAITFLTGRKIEGGARQYPRLVALYTASAAPGQHAKTRDQQVSGRNPT